jgi:long-chain fatty acid transport protein
MFYNVAGLAKQHKLSAMVGGTAITFANEFTGSENSFPYGDATARYANHVFVPPNTYAVVPIGDHAAFGFAQFSAFGLRTHWDNPNTFVGRFLAQDTNLKTLSLQPSFAMEMGPFSWGLGIEYRTSHVTLARNSGAINPFNERFTDIAHARLDSDWNNAWGWTAGALLNLGDKATLGASYRAPMDITYKGKAVFTQIPSGNPIFDQIVHGRIPPNQNIETTIAYPANASLGLSTRLIPNWNVEFDVDWMQWSRFDNLTVDFSNAATPDLVVGEKWKDAYSYRLGANHPVTEHWDVRLGALYDETPQPVAAVNPLLPDADRYGVSFGVGFHGAHWSVDVTEFALVFGTRNTLDKNPNFNGTYSTTANLASLNVGYTF